MTRSPPQRIYIDFDDVLCETALGLIDIARREFGRDIAFEQIHSFNLWETLDLSREEYEHLMELGHRVDFLAALTPIQGAREVLTDWVEEGLRVSIVTGRPPSCADVSRHWLERHAVPVSDIVFVDKYGRNDPGDASISPDELAHSDFALAIEDAPAMAMHIVTHTTFPLVIYDRPWNRKFPTGDHPRPGQAMRARSWADIDRHWRTWLD